MHADYRAKHQQETSLAEQIRERKQQTCADGDQAETKQPGEYTTNHSMSSGPSTHHAYSCSNRQFGQQNARTLCCTFPVTIVFPQNDTSGFPATQVDAISQPLCALSTMNPSTIVTSQV